MQNKNGPAAKTNNAICIHPNAVTGFDFFTTGISSTGSGGA